MKLSEFNITGPTPEILRSKSSIFLPRRQSSVRAASPRFAAVAIQDPGGQQEDGFIEHSQPVYDVGNPGYRFSWASNPGLAAQGSSQ